MGSPRVRAADRPVLGTSSSICADSQLGHHCVQQRCAPFVRPRRLPIADIEEGEGAEENCHAQHVQHL